MRSIEYSMRYSTMNKGRKMQGFLGANTCRIRSSQPPHTRKHVCLQTPAIHKIFELSNIEFTGYYWINERHCVWFSGLNPLRPRIQYHRAKHLSLSLIVWV